MSSVEERIAHATGIPLTHGEPSQVLRYGRGQQYTLHPDFFDPKDKRQLGNGGNRQATLLVYLNTLDEASGGATHFPKADLRVHPRCGDAVLWYNTHCDGRVDPDSTHAGEPVLSSTTKWVLSKWLRQRPFEVDVRSFEREPGRGGGGGAAAPRVVLRGRADLGRLVVRAGRRRARREALDVRRPRAFLGQRGLAVAWIGGDAFGRRGVSSDQWLLKWYGSPAKCPG